MFIDQRRDSAEAHAVRDGLDEAMFWMISVCAVCAAGFAALVAGAVVARMFSGEPLL